MKNNSKLFVGLLLAVAAGATLALLANTEKGKEVVSDIKDAAGRAQKDIKNALKHLEETLDKGKELAENLERKASRLVKKSGI